MIIVYLPVLAIDVKLIRKIKASTRCIISFFILIPIKDVILENYINIAAHSNMGKKKEKRTWETTYYFNIPYCFPDRLHIRQALFAITSSRLSITDYVFIFI
jgi:hypothetical protein